MRTPPVTICWRALLPSFFNVPQLAIEASLCTSVSVVLLN